MFNRNKKRIAALEAEVLDLQRKAGEVSGKVAALLYANRCRMQEIKDLQKNIPKGR